MDPALNNRSISGDNSTTELASSPSSSSPSSSSSTSSSSSISLSPSSSSSRLRSLSFSAPTSPVAPKKQRLQAEPDALLLSAPTSASSSPSSSSKGSIRDYFALKPKGKENAQSLLQREKESQGAAMSTVADLGLMSPELEVEGRLLPSPPPQISMATAMTGPVTTSLPGGADAADQPAQKSWRSLYTAGMKAYQQKYYMKAKAFLTEAIQLKPTSAPLYEARAAINEKISLKDSLEDAKMVIAYEPSSPKGYSRAGKILLANKQFADALKIFEDGLQNVSPSDPAREKLKEYTNTTREKMTTQERLEAQQSASNIVIRFPQEILVRIFGYLSPQDIEACRMVSRQWRFHLNEPLLYRSVNISSYWRKVTNKVLESLTGRGRWNLRALNVSRCKNLTDLSLKSLVKNGCTNVTALDLSHCRFSDEAIIQLLQKQGPKLEVLNLSSTSISSMVVQAVSKYCWKLVSLDLSSCPEIRPAAFKGFPSLSKLKTLSLSNSSEINDQALINAIEGCPAIEVLSLDKCTNLTPLSLMNIGRCLPSLKKLLVDVPTSSGAAPLSLDDAVLALAEGCEQLSHLEVPKGGLTHTSVEYIAGFCSNLRILHLGQCKDLTDATLASIGQGCEGLESLVLSNAPQITDAGTRQLLTKTPSLSDLTISYSHSISDVTARLLGESQGPQLKNLVLSNCSGFTSSGLQSIATKCPNLRMFFIGYCTSLSMGVLERLRQQLPRCEIRYEA